MRFLVMDPYNIWSLVAKINGSWPFNAQASIFFYKQQSLGQEMTKHPKGISKTNTIEKHM